MLAFSPAKLAAQAALVQELLLLQPSQVRGGAALLCGWCRVHASVGAGASLRVTLTAWAPCWRLPPLRCSTIPR